jgi:hypothetical protein
MADRFMVKKEISPYKVASASTQKNDEKQELK